MAVERQNPYGAFNFRVEFDNGILAAFSEVTGLDSEQGVIDYRTGDEETVTRKIPGIRKHPNVVMKRGIIGSDNLFKWRDEIVRGIGNVDDTEGKTTVKIHLLNEKREVVATWKLKKAWPVKWMGPAMAASKNE